MSNIVERLRSPANVFYEYAADNGAFLREAADEITRLRAELAAANTRMSKLDFERTAAELERDALAARLAPVEDDALVEIVAKVLQRGSQLEWSVLPEEWKNDWRRDARVAIAAIRPHIEAAERERCAKIAETPDLWVTDKPSRGCDDIAAAIRRGK